MRSSYSFGPALVGCCVMLRMMIDAYKMFPEYEEAPSDK
jgi:hypothetical protein